MQKLILIADDYEPDAAYLQHSLKKAGIKNPMVVVKDGDEVLAYLKGKEPYSDRTKFPLPSVLFLDSKMRRVGGFQVLTWLRHRPELRSMLIVVLTGYQERLKDASLAYELGANTFLAKPCQPEYIDALVKGFPNSW